MVRNTKYTDKELKDFFKNYGSEYISGEYKNVSSELIIKCRECGENYIQKFSNFKASKYKVCSNCYSKVKINTTKFDYKYIKYFIEKNSNCTLLSKEYLNQKTKLKFMCNCKNKNIFYSDFSSFKDRNKRQCNECGIKIRASKRALTYNEVKTFIENNTTCKLLSKEYINVDSILSLECECKEKFDTTFKAIKYNNKNKCNRCSIKELHKKQALNIEDVKLYIETKGCSLLSKVYKNIDSNLKITCKKCKKHYRVSFNRFKGKNKHYCNDCSVTSKGELKIKEYLQNEIIKFIPQHTFKDCRYKNPLHFDFYLLDYNITIEYDGEFHSKAIRIGNISQERAEENLRQQQLRDKIKTNYCKQNNITLLRIPYTQFNNIEEILTKTLILR